MKAAVQPLLEGQVEGAVIHLPRGTRLRTGSRVGIIPLDPMPGDPPFLKAMLRLADRREQRSSRPRKAAGV